MRVLVCGAGQVGYHIARTLAAEDNDVTVIDQDEDLVQKVTRTLDVQGAVGHASHPDVLERAGAANADLLVAVTYADEVNMIACQVAHSLFEVPTKIARIRAQSYLNPTWADLYARDRLPIDIIISPEIEVARAIGRRLKVPGAFDMIPLAGGLSSYEPKAAPRSGSRSKSWTMRDSVSVCTTQSASTNTMMSPRETSKPLLRA